MKLRFVVAFILCLVTGCDDSAKRENAELNAKLILLTSERAKAESNFTLKQSELSSALERLADSKARVDDLRLEIAALRESNAKLNLQVAEVKARLTASEHVVNEQTALLVRKKSEFDAEIQKLRAERKGELSGVVSYFFNKNYGYKPDVGAKIYVFLEDSYPKTSTELFLKFGLVGRLIRTRDLNLEMISTLSSSTDSERNAVQKATSDLEKIGIRNDKDLELLNMDAVKAFNDIESGKDTIVLTADGNGAFKRSLTPGNYFIIIQSQHRRGDGIFEVGGKIFSRSFKIVGDDEVNISFEFEAYR